ncbi:MAG: von Willebrand factor type A domain-containing protein [Candidatus Tectomicrobia bacterium]|nr:von Willebrand factor type A domain-containing protein [Candidatus Tectomicrobia bacterium]
MAETTDLSASLPAAESTPRPLAEPASPPVEPATAAEMERAELAETTDLSASLPAAESPSRPLAAPVSPLLESPPPEVVIITQAEVGEVLESVAPAASPAGADPPVESLRRARPLAQELAGREGRILRSVMDPSATRTAPSRFARDPSQGRDRFSRFDANPVKVTAEEPVSTFSIDVDTASYSFLRAALHRGALPQQDAVRTEELINYFPYDYAPPDSRETPFAAHVSLMPSPWNAANRLLHVGIKGYAADRAAAPRANLVFLIDTSGSMDEPNKLPLLVNSFKLLLGVLDPEDTVAIVSYAGSAGTVLPPTRAAERGKISASLERLYARGTTAGGEGIRQAYLLAEQHFVEDGVNRVILATDGDFNVGITDPDELESFIARKRDSGVFLSVLGFGMGNYNDELMQRLAQNGNGNAAYIDSLSEARKVLVEEATSTLFPIAKDVKIQVEFNPALVSEYRLIGYETRVLQREDFLNDKVDAGEIGIGHTVTAIYELTPVGSGAERIAPLRYQEQEEAAGTAFTGEYAFVKIRYKLPDSDTSTEMARAVTQADAFESLEAAPQEARFAAAVAAFGQLMRGGQYTGDFSYDDVIALAQAARGEDPFGYRSEFISLVRLAQSAAEMLPLPR